MSTIFELKNDLKKLADPKRAKISQRFFKTGKGEYGEGDIFIGLTVPQSRKIAIKFKDLPFSEITKLLKSKVHEERLIALLILVNNFNIGDDKISHFAKASRDKQKATYNFYLKNIKCVNNWDLVDLSADKIVGGYLFSLGSTRSLNKRRGPVKSNPSRQGSPSTSLRVHAVGSPSSFATPFLLTKLAHSKNIWERRIAMIATYYFIKNGKFEETLKIAEILLLDKHDLIRKAVGWMLREVGNRDLPTEIKFLNKYYKRMPRTTLRYAIEKFPEELRLKYLRNKI